MTAWREERRPVERMPRMTVEELRERDGGVQVLDVREHEEFAAGRVPGSVSTPYHDLHAIPDGIDPDRPVAVICASGQRAAVGASLLRRHGAREVWHVVDGGVPAWRRAGFPVESG
jgi:rhodanese-related sulfurtransferase